ncbi:MAG: hypothetical protein IK118_08295, partial [Clostridia bacterium]|nr:hypothetical protein [Clostridia bacterium]
MKPYFYPARLYFQNRRKKEHNPGPYLGQAFDVPRVGKADVRVRLYRPAEGGDGPLPVLFNVHGGGW